MKFLRHIQSCNQHNPDDFVAFIVDGKQVGRFRHQFAAGLAEWADVFVIEEGSISLSPQLQTYSQRSNAIDTLLRQLLTRNEHPYMMDEMYAVTASNHQHAVFEIDRSAAALFGIRTFGQHVNAFVQKPDGLYMWLGQRAADKRTFPGMLDQLVAGGLPVTETLAGNLSKECYEEAGIEAHTAQTAVAVGTVSYNVDTPAGFKYDTLYCYDLELPADFTPHCTDGEVDEFKLLPIEEVMKIVQETDNFKPNCNLVVIDFLIRHGYITPEHDEYLGLATGLRPKMKQELR